MVLTRTKQEIEGMEIKETMENEIMKQRVYKIVGEMLTKDLTTLYNQLVDNTTPTAEELVEEVKLN